MGKLGKIAAYHKWLWVAMLIFCGTTGVVLSLYPEFSGLSANANGMITALVSVATAAAVYGVSRMRFARLTLSIVRLAGVLLAVSVPLILLTPIGMVCVGALFGVITVAVLNYIAETNQPQGVMNGMLNTTQYAGMAILPFAAGMLILPAGYAFVFVLTAGLNVLAGLLVYAARVMSNKKRRIRFFSEEHPHQALRQGSPDQTREMRSGIGAGLSERWLPRSLRSLELRSARVTRSSP